ncbi:DUF4184 family protein [Clostridium tunisiense]|uniref:DUF4184 family protein n=1 Tax=Clostridium tunisiense TaxID=219748 RepID=UPI0002F891D9|nr:DUF4184 family protein [Clostridium tunisiense]
MPFTLSHPAAVIFSQNKLLNLGGLILGSMAPDFIYFILFSPSSNTGHTLWGFLFLNLPLCFLLNFLFYNYIQDILFLTLPGSMSKYYVYLKNRKNKINSIKSFVVFTYSCIIGMLTHVFWDGFTHSSGFFVNHITFLRNKIALFHYKVPIYKLLQHGSSVIGFFILFIFIFSIRDKNSSTINLSINKFNLWISILLIQGVILGASFLFSIFFQGYFGIGRLVVTLINGLFLGYLITGILYRNRCTS